MKKVIALCGIYMLMLLSMVSCKDQHYLITDVRILGASVELYTGNELSPHYDSTSVFEKDVIFVLSYSTEYVAGLKNIEMIQSCYATTLNRVNDNQLLRDSYSLVFDRNFVYDNDTVYAGQNIFANEKIKAEINISEANQGFVNAGANEVFDFSDNLIQKAKFETGLHKTTFSCKTSDNKEFVKSIDVEFKLN